MRSASAYRTVSIKGVPKWRAVGKVFHTNSLLKKGPTSAVVEGPPIFMKTIAVGPLDDVTFCVTGGVTTEAIARCGLCQTAC